MLTNSLSKPKAVSVNIIYGPELTLTAVFLLTNN